MTLIYALFISHHRRDAWVKKTKKGGLNPPHTFVAIEMKRP
jgi:hypothetical protein